jgi:hypothetical protein
MTLQRVVLGLVLVGNTLLSLQLQHVAKGGLKRLVLGWLLQVMIHFGSLSLSMEQGNVHFACKFFFSFFSIFLQTIFTGPFMKMMGLSKYTIIKSLLRQVLCVPICSAAMQRSGFRSVGRKVLH